MRYIVYQNFEINDANDLVKGFAIAVRDKEMTLSGVYDFVLDCTEGDVRLTKVVIEKVQIQLECMEYMSYNQAVA